MELLVRTFLRTLAVALSAVLIAGCGDGGPGGNAAATVNGDDIPRDLLERVVEAEVAAQAEPLEGDELTAFTADTQRAILSALISFEIIADIAEEEGIEPSTEDLDAQLEEEIELSGGEEAFDDFLDQIGLTREEYRDTILANNVRQEALAEALAPEVDEADLRAFFDEQRETRFETRTTRHILVDSQDEADDVVAQLEDGADFAELAGELSTDPGSGEQGGDLGANPRGVFVPEFEDAVWEAELNEVIGPVESDFGFHVIEVTDEDAPEFEEVRDEIEAELAAGESQAAVQERISTAVAEAEVEVDSAFGEWDAEAGQVVDPERVGEAPAPGEAPEGGAPGDLPTEEDLENMSEEELMQMLEDMMGEQPTAP